MVLVDTSVWIDHLRAHNTVLSELLEQGTVLCHPFVIGEIALGSLVNRASVLDPLRNLPPATVAHDDEVLQFISSNNLFAQGIGYVDAHLLASVRLTPHASLWSRDRRLREVAAKLSLVFHP